MIISYSKNFIFFSNGKVASTSIERGLSNWDETSYEQFSIPGLFSERHITPIFVKAMISDKFWDNSFKFIFVRNPFDWFVSSYIYQYRFTTKLWFKECIRNPLIIPHRLKCLIPYYFNSKRTLFKKKHVIDAFNRFKLVKGVPNAKGLTQYCYAYDLQGDKMVDFIGKYENLKNDFEKIKVKLNIPDAKLPYENKSSTRKSSNKVFFTEEAVNTIIDLWKIDFEVFGYSTKLPNNFKIIS